MLAPPAGVDDLESRYHHGPPTQATGGHVPIHYVRAILSRAAACGIDPDEIVRDSGVPPEVFDHNEWDVSAADYVQFMSRIAIQLDDELLGFGKTPIPVGTCAFLGRSLVDARTLGQAIERWCRFFHIIRRGISFTLTDEGDTACLTMVIDLATTEEEARCYAHELMVFISHRLMNWLIKESVPLDVVSFSCETPPHHAIMQIYFMTTLLQFNARETRLTFDRRFLQSRIRQDAASMQAMLGERGLDLFVRRYNELSWSARLKNIIGGNLNDIPTFEDIASRLVIHPQTLRRRLAEEGTTFRDLKVSVRREAGFLLLRSTDMPVEEIATKTGFSQASAFTRAFREWTGCTPQAFRRKFVDARLHT